jgi:hypothetical protein
MPAKGSICALFSLPGQWQSILYQYDESAMSIDLKGFEAYSHDPR